MSRRCPDEVCDSLGHCLGSGQLVFTVNTGVLGLNGVDQWIHVISRGVGL